MRVFYLFLLTLSLCFTQCPEGFYEDSCSNCWLPYCYDYTSHQVSYDLDETDCNGTTEMWVIPGDPGDPYFDSFCESSCPDNFLLDDCDHCWQSFCYSFFSPGLNGDPPHSVYYDLSVEECEEYGYNYYSADHPSNPYWNSNCTTDCNGVLGGDAMVDDCGECLSGYCYDYVTHEVSFGDCNGATQMWVMPDDPMNPYWNASCLDCGLGDFNSDLIVNVTDIVAMVNIILEQVQPSYEQLCNGDSNNDCIINVVDVVHIVNYILDN